MRQILSKVKPALFRTALPVQRPSYSLLKLNLLVVGMASTTQDVEARKTFLSTFNRISEEHLRSLDPRLEDARNRYRTVFDFNSTGGKLNRGQTVVAAIQDINENCTEEDIELARIVGWGIELLQSYFLIDDDIEDASETRRGKPCWYKVPGVGMQAINDSCFLRATVFQILKRYLKHHPMKWPIVELFLDYDFHTVMGQTMDMRSIPFEKFSMDQVSIVYEFKTAYYSFALPVRAAMFLAGITDPILHKNAESILLKIGHFFQVQDDFLDCYGDPKITGKIGTDIQDSKCTWLVVQALEYGNHDQRKVLKDNYGKHDEKAVEAVKGVYEQLNIKGMFLKYEEEEYQRLLQEIHSKCTSKTGLQPKVFEDVLHQINKRQK